MIQNENTYRKYKKNHKFRHYYLEIINLRYYYSEIINLTYYNSKIIDQNGLYEHFFWFSN